MSLPAAWQTLEVTAPAPHVLLVTLNRPAVANALNTQMGTDLRDLWVGLTRDAGDTRAVVLTGSGTKAFCAGGDLKERNGMTVETWQRQHEIFEEAYWTLMELPVPVIAAVNGHAYAGGLEMALACDFAYAVPGARFALTEVTIGIMPGAGGTQNLPRAVGERRAKEIILTGRPFSAAEALEWGVLNRVVEPEQLLASGARDREDHRGQRAAFGAPGEEVDPSGLADRLAHGPAHRGRGVQPPDRHRGPPGRHRRVQREAQAAVSRPVASAK